MPEHIEGAGAQLFRQLAREQNLRSLGADDFASRAGHYLGEINALHPFREGNGRAQRASSVSSPATPAIPLPGIVSAGTT
ncbi:Fic family protein (plasmid) [Xanthomonas hortorum pv. pelargonii]|nr:Fic family protein [Xanthomonas hortorum pv. pelargonii]